MRMTEAGEWTAAIVAPVLLVATLLALAVIAIAVFNL
jgi:hypothetical protein